jgi:acetyl-CoA acetyltransferase
MMQLAFICDYGRTPIGRYGGSLSSIRADDLGALPLTTLQERHPSMDWQDVVDVIFGCANQAGEDNRCVESMSGARITGTAASALARGEGKRALATMCIGVGQGIAIALAGV